MFGNTALLCSVGKVGLPLIDTGLGRSYCRHPTEPGTVISWFDVGTNKQVNLLVFDAVKRMDNLSWNPYSYSPPDSPLPNLTQPNTNGTWYIDGSNTTVTLTTASRLTEAQLNTLWPASVIDPNTAKYNCDVWYDKQNGPVVSHARSIKTLDGYKADIPNIQQLMRIFCMVSVIDALDPTAETNRSLKLANWRYAWASSDFSYDKVRLFGPTGACGSDMKMNNHRAIPVLELES